MIKKLIKWLMQNKKRRYEVVYIATGYMGNKYDAGIFEFYVSDRGIKEVGNIDFMQYGFHKNFKVLSKHFPANSKGLHSYTAAEIIEDKQHE